MDDLTTANLVEIIGSGCTTQVEMALSIRHAESYVRVAEKLGIRGYVGPMVPQITRVRPIWSAAQTSDIAPYDPETLVEIEASLKFGQSVTMRSGDRIRPMLAVSVVATHTRETLRALGVAADSLDCPIQIHIQSGSGDDYPNDLVLRNTGAREIPLLEDLGLLSHHVFGAHLLGVDPPADLKLLAREEFTFVHCPTAGGAAVNPSSQPYPEALALGVNTALGLDAHSGDFLENVKLAVIEGRAREHLLGGSSSIPLRRPSIWDAVRSGTLGAALGLGRDDLGRITPGAKADLCSIDVSGLHVGSGTLPLAPLNNLLYANARDVRNVMIDGVWKVRNRRLLVGNRQEISLRRGVVMSNLWERLPREGGEESSVEDHASRQR